MKKLMNCTIIIKNIKESMLQKEYTSKTTGFSLIELMVSVGVIGILTSVVAVVYPTYNSKSQISSTMLLLESYVKKAENYYVENNVNNNGFLKKTGGSINIDDIGGYTATNTDIVSSITATRSTTTNTDGTIAGEILTLSATFNNKAVNSLNGNSLSLMITASDGNFAITCSSSNIPKDYLPSMCQ